MTTRIAAYIIETAQNVLEDPRKFGRLLEKYNVTDPDLTGNVYRLAFYVSQLEKGVDPQIAAMTACQAAPRSMTDREFFQGMGTLSEQFRGEERYLQGVIAGAKRAGYTPSPHDVYLSNLAQFQGDPQAFVPPTGGRNHIRRVCESRNIPCEGSVNVKASEKEPSGKKVSLAEDIIQAKIRSRVRRDPSLRGKTRELREAIVAKHGSAA